MESIDENEIYLQKACLYFQSQTCTEPAAIFLTIDKALIFDSAHFSPRKPVYGLVNSGEQCLPITHLCHKYTYEKAISVVMNMLYLAITCTLATSHNGNYLVKVSF